MFIKLKQRQTIDFSKCEGIYLTLSSSYSEIYSIGFNFPNDVKYGNWEIEFTPNQADTMIKHIIKSSINGTEFYDFEESAKEIKKLSS